MGGRNCTATNIKENLSTIKIADGTDLETNGRGNVTMRVENGQNDVEITLKDVILSKDLERNLISVSRLTDNGAKVTFYNDKAVVEKGNDVVMEATKRNGLYIVTSSVDMKSKSFSAEERKELWRNGDINLWHQRLGHVSEDVVKKSIPVSGTLKYCKACLLSKADRKPFEEVIERENFNLERVYSDICGPMEQTTFGGARYFISFVDGHSRMIDVYLIARKDEAFDKFKQYKARVEKELGRKIVNLRTDNGGEYRNKEFQSYCKESGIRMEFTVPYTSPQNGVAERTNRTLMNMARTMLIGSSMEKQYWGEAVVTSAFIKNRLASRVLQWKSPFELWYGRAPNMENLKVFGSIAYARIPSENRRKLDERSKKVIMLGYDLTAKNYRLKDYEQNEIIRSRDVNFLENQFVENQEQDIEVSEQKPEAKDYQETVEDKDITEEKEEPEELFEDALTDIPETKSGRKIIKPSWMQDYVSHAVREDLEIQVFNDPDPISYEEAISAKDKELWKASMEEEIKNLNKNQTWELVDKPKDKNILGCKWVYRKKKGVDGKISRYRSRLVAQGFTQKYGSDYMETYSPVADYTTMRWMFSVAANLDLEITHLDFECAYLNGKLADEQEIYMKPPPGFNQVLGQVLKLKKCLYGLKQSGRYWNIELNRVLLSCGLMQCGADKCLYMNRNSGKITLLLLYVDDIAIASNDLNFVQIVKEKLAEEFVVKDLGPMSKFLNIRVSQDRNYVSIDQEQLIDNLLEKYGMKNCNPVYTPIELGSANEVSEELSPQFPFRALVGSLNYIANTTRPDISFAVNKLARKVEAPSNKDWSAGKRILRYLNGTKELKLRYERNQTINLKIFTDADYAGDTDKISTSGYVALVNNAPISWFSRKQQIIALSTMESEYIALSLAAQEAIYLKQLYEFIGKKLDLKFYVDNQSCILFASNEKGLRRNTRHIMVKYHHVKDLVEQKMLTLQHVASNENVADVLTKALPKIKHQAALESMKMIIKVQGEYCKEL